MAQPCEVSENILIDIEILKKQTEVLDERTDRVENKLEVLPAIKKSADFLEERVSRFEDRLEVLPAIQQCVEDIKNICAGCRKQLSEQNEKQISSDNKIISLETKSSLLWYITIILVLGTVLTKVLTTLL